MTFLIDAAKYYKELPHQDAAWRWFEGQLPEYLLDEFRERFRDAPVSSSQLITPEVFERLTGYSRDLFSQEECDDCMKMLKETGFIKHREATCMLMANILHETGNMRWLKELSSGWSYESRADLGNDQPGDGPRFKGAGVLQLTGRYNYSRLSKALRDRRVMEGCDYVASTYPFRSAVIWIRENNLLTIAKTKGFEAVCVRINGGYNGYEDRLAKYSVCKSVLM